MNSMNSIFNGALWSALSHEVAFVDQCLKQTIIVALIRMRNYPLDIASIAEQLKNILKSCNTICFTYDCNKHDIVYLMI